MGLPSGFSHWSSIVICFKLHGGEGKIVVYALDCDDGSVYHILDYHPVYTHSSLFGYTCADLKLYFVGHKCDVAESLLVKVYDIPNARWINDVPKLNGPKPAPFVFFLDGKLHVLSSATPDEHFEMLDIHNASPEWEPLPEPSFVSQDHYAVHHNSILDHSKKMFWVRLLDTSCYDSIEADLYAYSLEDNKWYEHHQLSEPSARMNNLLKASWSQHSVIVGDYLYRFQVLRYPDKEQATLIIRDLEHQISVSDRSIDDDSPCDTHDKDDKVDGTWKVDISSVVAPYVPLHVNSVGCLVYLGNRRFALFITYICEECKGDYHVYACSFCLRKESSTFSVGQYTRPECVHVNVGSSSFLCQKLCEVMDD